MLSQRMHSAGFRELGLPFHYSACDVQDTAGAVAAMRALGIRGASLTIPHKERALALVDTRSEEAKSIGAINTIVNDGEQLHGYNTDWIGVMDALHEAETVRGEQFRRKRALVIGAGGAAKAGVFGLQRWGVTEVLLTNRNAPRGDEAARATGARFVPISDLAEHCRGIDLVVNATPVGSHLVAEERYPLPEELVKKLLPQVVFDMVTRETPLLAWAGLTGAVSIAGARMLLFQALAQFRYFTEHEAPREVMERALLTELRASA